MIEQFPEQRSAIVEVGRKLYNRGYLAGGDGNISVRLPDGNILITPTGKAKGELKSAELTTLRPDGREIFAEQKASSESKMHLYAYQERSDINACVHSHAPYCTALATAGIEPPHDLLPETVLFVGRICLTEYAPPGTDAVPRALAGLIEEHNAFLLRNHGLLTIGKDIQEAYWRHETTEHFAKIYFLARQLGEPQPIPADDFERLTSMREAMSKGTK